jgi:hypothetical protein
MKKINFNNKKVIFMICKVQDPATDINLIVSNKTSITGKVFNIEKNINVYYFSVEEELNQIYFKSTKGFLGWYTETISRKFQLRKNNQTNYYFLFGNLFERNEEELVSSLDTITEECQYFIYFLLTQKFYKEKKEKKEKKVEKNKNEQDELDVILKKISALKKDYIYESVYRQKIIWEPKDNLDHLINNLSQAPHKHRNFVILLSCLDMFRFEYLIDSKCLEELVKCLVQVEENFISKFPLIFKELRVGTKLVINASFIQEKDLWLQYFMSDLLPVKFERNEIFLSLLGCIKQYPTTSKNMEFLALCKKFFTDYFKREKMTLKVPYNELIRALCILLPNKEHVIEFLFSQLDNDCKDMRNLFQIFRDKLESCEWFDYYNRDKFLIKYFIELNENHMNEAYTIYLENLLYSLIDTFSLFQTIHRKFKENLNADRLGIVLVGLRDLQLYDYVTLIGIMNECSSMTRSKLLKDELKEPIVKLIHNYPPHSLEKEAETLKSIMLCDYFITYTTFLELIEYFFVERNLNTFEISFLINMVLEKNLDERDMQNLVLKITKNLLKRFVNEWLTLNTFFEIISLLKGYNQLIENICKQVFDYFLIKYGIDKSIVLINSFNETPRFKDTPLENNYIKFLEQNFTFINNFDKEKCLNLLDEISHEEGNIKSNCKSCETFINLLLTNYEKNIDSKLFSSEVIRSPDESNIITRCLLAEGTHNSFIGHKYVQSVRLYIVVFIKGLLDSSIQFETISDLASLKDDQIYSLNYIFNSVFKGDYSERLNYIISTYNKIQQTYDSVETFYHNFNHKLNDLNKLINNYRKLFESLLSISLREYKLEDKLEQLIDSFGFINSWYETEMFKCILENKLEELIKDNKFMLENDNRSSIGEMLSKSGDRRFSSNSNAICEFFNMVEGKIQNDDKIETEIFIEEISSNVNITLKMGTEKFILFALQIIMEIEETLPKQMTTYPPEMTLKSLYYFRNLNDPQDEIQKFKKLCRLSNSQVENLSKTIANVNNINIILKFSKVMAEFDSRYMTSKNNKDLYLEVIAIFENKNEDISFHILEHKLYQIKLIRDEYISIHVDIENVLAGFIEAESILKFLKSNSEDDIRNLMYAVDELSDSNVRQTDILELIKIDSFIRKIELDDDITNKFDSEKSIVNCIAGLMNDSTYNNIDTTINLCIKKFEEIKSLFNNLSNREEACRSKIINILNSSTFKFVYDEEDKSYRFQANYINSHNITNELSFDDLRNLKERVCIIKINNENNQEEINELFKKTVEMIYDILRQLDNMIDNGYPEYFNESVEIKSRCLEPLVNFNSNLEKSNGDWLNERESAFKIYYPLTYFNGAQFWELEKLFKDCQLQCLGYNLLRSIYSDINEKDVISRKYNSSNSSKERLSMLGLILNDLFDTKVENIVHINNKENVKLNLKNSKVILSCPEVKNTYPTLLSINFNLCGSFPSPAHILYCRKTTSYFELYSFLLRLILCKKEQRVFTILQPEELQYDLQENIFHALKEVFSNEELKCYLSIICNDKDNPFYGQLTENPNVFKNEYIMDAIIMKSNLTDINSYILTSDFTGAGKTHYIKKQFKSNHKYENFLISDRLDINEIAKRFYDLTSTLIKGNPIHITISGKIDDHRLLDHILFNILILKSFTFDIYSSLVQDNPIYLEIANSFNNDLFLSTNLANLIPNVIHLTCNDITNNFEVDLSNQNIQLVCNYLYLYKENLIDHEDIHMDSLRLMDKEHSNLLLNYYFFNTQPQASFKQFNIFINILADQFKRFSSSYYYSVDHLKYCFFGLTDLRSKLLKILLMLPQEFITRSIKSATDKQNKTLSLIYNEDEYSYVKSWTSSNHLLVIFDSDGQCLHYIFKDKSELPSEIIDLAKLYYTELNDINPSKFTHRRFIEELFSIEGRYGLIPADIDKVKYKLTLDNFIKMILILIRARAKVPIVIMGETGCGKTSLIRFLTQIVLNEELEVINFHAGITKEYIISRMNSIIFKANLLLEITATRFWVFLDEINTCNCLGLIADIICQRSLQGQPLPDNIIIVSACNPYRLRSKQDKGIGLVKQRIQNNLVYTVNPLPETILDYVWDYGSLSDDDERIYINTILSDMSGFLKEKAIALVYEAQIFIRQAEGRYSVSLRDIERFKTLHEWFYKILRVKNSREFTNHKHKFKYRNDDHNLNMKAILLAMSMCYYNRLSDRALRNNFYHQVAFKILEIYEDDFHDMMRDEQMDFLTRMELPPAIALNSAILENVFTLIVCALNKIPLFICGKPGCSKSLAVQLVVSNIRGKFSTDKFFQTLPQIVPHVYQGSESSTSEGINAVFDKAEKAYNEKLNNKDEHEVIQMIYFDEIGLAEISKNNPLKILHSLLEPEIPKLAFVGISNWKLDASKMNRAIYLSRPDLDDADLIKSGSSILSYYLKNRKEDTLINNLAKSYLEFIASYYRSDCPNLYGTRDYYSLIKKIARDLNSISYENYERKKGEIIRKSIQRNFGGKANSIKNFLLIYNEHTLGRFYYEQDTINCVDLVLDNLTDKYSRFMLIFTNGDSASYILDNHLKDKLENRTVLIGSEFEEDKDHEDYVFKMLSDIVLYIESGRSIIMKNLDCIYGALYDLFNQNYTVVNKKKNCRISLGKTNNPMCYVHDDFHCIVLADQNRLKEMDPPFLNRFEKQLLTFDTILTEDQYKIISGLKSWVDDLSFIADNDLRKSFKLDDLIMGYDKDLECLKNLVILNNNLPRASIVDKCKYDILSICNSNLLLLCTVSEINIRRPGEIEKIYDIYFNQQQHESLSHYINSLSGTINNRLIVYTYSNYLSEISLSCVYTTVCLSELKTEKDFDKKMSNEFNSGSELILIKINWVKETNFISYLLFRLDNLIKEYEKNTQKSLNVNIALVVYLSRKEKPNQQLPNLFLSGWSQIFLEYLNGAGLNSLQTFLIKSSSEILSYYLFETNIVSELLRDDICLKFNYITLDKSDNTTVESYKQMILGNFEKNDFIKTIINNNLLEMIGSRIDGRALVKDLCFNQDIQNKSDNFSNRIKMLISDIIKYPLLQVIYKLEAFNAIETILTNDNNQLVEFVLDDYFQSQDFGNLKPYEILQSMDIELIFDLKYPFSRKEIQHISRITAYNLECYVCQENNLMHDDTMAEQLETTFNIIKETFRKHSSLYKLPSDLRTMDIVESYILDIINYYSTIELKISKEYRCQLTEFMKSLFRFNLNNLEFIYLYLWKNKKIFSLFFETLSDLEIFIPDVKEPFTTVERYNDSLLLINNDTRKQTEILIFNELFNNLVKLTLSRMHDLVGDKDKLPFVFSNLVQTLLSYKRQCTCELDGFNIIKIVNEFCNIITTGCFDNLYHNLFDFFPKNSQDINLKDFSFVPGLFSEIDLALNGLEYLKELIIDSKLNIFEFLISAKEVICLEHGVEIDIKKELILNILKDKELLNRSSILMYKLFKDYIQSEDEDTDYKPKDLMPLKKSTLAEVIDSHLSDRNNVGFIYYYFTDFFKGSLYSPPEDKRIEYLGEQFEIFTQYIGLLNNESFFNRIIALAGIKHYLEIFSVCTDTDNDLRFAVLSEINMILEGKSMVREYKVNLTEEYLEVFRIYVLKILMRERSCKAVGLMNYDFDLAGIRWIGKNSFETNLNSLGIDAFIPILENCWKSHTQVFEDIINNPNSEENRTRFRQFIIDSHACSEMKFVFIQFFILKVYAYFSNANFVNSFSYSVYKDIFNLYVDDITKYLGQPITSFLNNLVYNFLTAKTDMFKLSPSASFPKLSAIITILQAFNMVLSYNDLVLNQLFSSALQSFENLNNLYLPGGYEHTDNEYYITYIDSVNKHYEEYGVKRGLYECNCGYLYEILDCTRPWDKSICPRCGLEIGGENIHKLVSTSTCLINADYKRSKDDLLSYIKSKMKDIPGYYIKSVSDMGDNFTIRNNNIRSFRFQDLITNGVLLSFYENGIIFDLKELDMLFKKGKDHEIDSLIYLETHINKDIEILTKINTNDIHILLTLYLDKLISVNIELMGNLDFSKPDSRLIYEDRLREALEKVNDISINDYKNKYSTKSELSSLQKLDEEYEESNPPSDLIMIFRPLKLGSWDDLLSKKEETTKKFVCLDILENRLDEISLLYNLPKIINFTNFMTDKFNHRVKRQDAKDKIIKDSLTDENILQLFNDFKQAWEGISYYITSYSNNSLQYNCRELIPMDSISENNAVAFVLPDDVELGYGMYMCAAFQYMGKIQNSLLNYFLETVEQNKAYKNQFIINNSLYPIQKVSQDDIIICDDVDFIKELYVKYYTIYQNEIGKASNIKYNFEKIDMHIASKLFLNKKKLDYENISKIQYQFELLSLRGNSSLITDIKAKVAQSAMEKDKYLEVAAYLGGNLDSRRNISQMNQIFRSLDYILCEIKYNSKSKTVNNLGEFINLLKTNNISPCLRDPPFNRLALNYIVHLYQIVESYMFKYEIESLSPDYNKQLSSEFEENLKNYLKIISSNNDTYPTLSEIQSMLERFILRYLFTTIDPFNRLIDYMAREDLWDLGMNEMKIELFIEKFPEEILLANVRVVWDLVRGLIEDQKPKAREPINLIKIMPVSKNPKRKNID